MCNPRRVCVSATSQLCEAWEQEIRRSVALRKLVTGAARVCQPLDASLGRPALRALELLLDQGQTGWHETEEGYRHDVEGGYVVYHPDEQTLEIVAELCEEVSAVAEAAAQLSGQVEGEVTAEGEATYYDDNYGGRTEVDAQRDAERDAQQKLEAARRAKVEEARRAAAQQAAGDVEAQARAAAAARLERESADRRERLEEQARSRLQTVGLRCRQAFHRLLGTAYRDAILAYARQNGAEQVECRETGDMVEIDFLVQR